jgi:hypothetical protein
MKKRPRLTDADLLATYELVMSSSVAAAARELGLSRPAVDRRVAGARKLLASAATEPVVRGRLDVVPAVVEVVPPRGRVARYLLTSAQNNTYVHEELWENLLVLAEHYNAKIMVGRYSYNKGSHGKKSVKADKGPTQDDLNDLWYDPKIAAHVVDSRVELAPGLVWCGEMQIIPTALRPLTGLDTYSGTDSAIFPHAKIAMSSVAQMMGSPAKLNYTTGTVTMRNYIARKEGLPTVQYLSKWTATGIGSSGKWMQGTTVLYKIWTISYRTVSLAKAKLQVFTGVIYTAIILTQ